MIDERIAASLDEAVAERSDAAFALLEQLVSVRSEVGTESDALVLVEHELTELGFATSVLPIPDDVTDDPAAGVPVVPYDGLRGPLVGRLAPHRQLDGARSLLLNGHLDVVPSGNVAGWSGEPFRARRESGWMVGRGTADMKGGVSMALLAIGALLDVMRDALGAELVFVGAIEEECTGNGTLATVHADVLADAVVITEPTGLDLLTAGVGVLWMEIGVVTSGGHAETAGDVPSALDLVTGLLPALRSLAPPTSGPDGPRYRVNVGRLRAGDWPSSVPSEATVDVRVGFPADWSSARAEAWTRQLIDEAVAAHAGLESEQVSVRPSGMRAEGYRLPAESELLTAIATAHHDAHGDRPALVSTEATTDARFYLNQGGVPAVCFGPRSRALHAAEEAVELDSIIQGARTLARFMAEWLGPEAAGGVRAHEPSKEDA